MRNEKIQNMSLLCAFLVVVIHCRPVFDMATPGWWMKQLLEAGICTIAVPFFFLISGFFLSRHTEDDGWYKREIGKRVFTLLVPYCIWCFLYILPSLILHQTIHPIRAIFGIDLVKMPILTPLWYIRGLFVLVLLSPLLVRFLQLKWIGLIILFLVYGIICPGPKGSGLLHGITRCGILPMAGIFYFTLGLFIGKNKLEYKVSGLIAAIALTVGLIFVFMQALFFYNGLTQWAQYWGWLAIPFMMLGIWGLLPAQRWPQWLVASAFPVYLIHKFFYAKIFVVFPKTTIWGYLVSVIVVFLLSVCTAIFLKRYFPKISGILFGGR